MYKYICRALQVSVGGNFIKNMPSYSYKYVMFIRVCIFISIYYMYRGSMK